jgi:cytochrome c553
MLKHAVMKTILVLTLLLLVSTGASGADKAKPVAKPIAKPTAEQLQFFETKIRPVLVASCYKCHSREKNKSKGDFQLDTREGLLKGGETGPVIVPGNAKASLFMRAIRHESEFLEMPPKSKLPANVIADFDKWIAMGAPDPRDGKAVVIEKPTIDFEKGRAFWSFQPLKQVSPPQVKNKTWSKTPVDQFILKRLEAAGLSPNPEASRVTLIRRVYFSLWGLPPTPAQVKAFVEDKSPDAYEKMVDQLLAGQHYGERWARHWLDLARFAESNGYAFDKDRNAAYHYRDFVIKALNQDMPYDEFIQLQIAGDQIKPGDYMAHAATGFLASGPFTSQQTQKERERSRYEQLDDIIATLGTATLGLTMGCARCHDHKYDPIAMDDYYRIAASFAEVGFDDFKYDRQPEVYKKAKAVYDAAHKPLVTARAAYEKDKLPAQLDAWLKDRPVDVIKPKLSEWQVVGPLKGANFDKAYDTAFGPERKVELTKPVGKDKLKWKLQPTWADGNILNVLTGENSANYLYRTIEVPTKGPLEISVGYDDAVRVYLNRRQVLAKKVMGGVSADQSKIKLNLNAGRNELVIKVINASGPSGFYFKVLDGGPPKNIQVILDLPADKRTPAHKQALVKWFAPYDEQWVKLDQAEKEHIKKAPKQELMPIFSARKGGTTYNFANNRKVYHLVRGNSNQKKAQAKPGFAQVLMTSKEHESQWLISHVPNGGKVSDSKKSPVASKPVLPRVAMGQWLTDQKQGAGQLLARVIVNRLWQHHLGRGIVRTPSDFGTQGEKPTHPQLLDYLAGELIRNDWKLKPIHKMIVTSSVYMQSGQLSDAGVKIDIDNKLWWRKPAVRLEAEAIRDALLSISGSLDTKMYGPGSLNQADKRRSVYLKVKRDKLIPILQLFDAPNALQSIGQRNVTTVPPQALAMMNSSYVRQHATMLSKRVKPAGDTAVAQVISSAYSIVLSRPPSATEVQTMATFIENQSASYGKDAKAKDAAIVDFCQLVLCLNEFMFVD